jgi:predicted flap endonuclease-1-like 5' DNA nuclease
MSGKNERWAFLLVAVLSALFFFWWFRRRLEQEGQSERAESPPTKRHPSRYLVLSPRATQHPKVEESPPPQDSAPEPDDLKRIEGIGPKISSVLQAAGITTYAQIATTVPDVLHQIVKEAGIRLAYPATWPEQAKLAAAGDWEALEALQSELKGGRRV